MKRLKYLWMAGALAAFVVPTHYSHAQNSFIISPPEVVVTDQNFAFVTFTTSAPTIGSVEYHTPGGTSQVVQETEYVLEHAVMIMVSPGVSIEGTVTATAGDNSKATAALGPLVPGMAATDVQFVHAPEVYLIWPGGIKGTTMAVVAFTTDQPTTAHADYGVAGTDVVTSVVDEELTTAHALFLPVESNKTYRVIVSATGADGSVVSEAPMTFTADAVLRDYGPGDVNGDSQVTIADALIALNYVVGKIPLSQIQVEAADLNSDGRVSVGDVVIILQGAIGITPA